MTGDVIRWQEVPPEARSHLAAMRERAREQAQAEAQAAWHRELMERCTDEAAVRLVGDPPARYVELMRDELASRYAGAVEQGGQSWAAYAATPGFDLAAFKEQMTREATLSLRRGLALDAVIEHEGLRLDEDDLRACLAGMAPGHEEQAAQALYESGQIVAVLDSALRTKAADHLARTAIDTSA